MCGRFEVEIETNRMKCFIRRCSWYACICVRYSMHVCIILHVCIVLHICSFIFLSLPIFFPWRPFYSTLDWFSIGDASIDFVCYVTIFVLSDLEIRYFFEIPGYMYTVLRALTSNFKAISRRLCLKSEFKANGQASCGVLEFPFPSIL